MDVERPRIFSMGDCRVFHGLDGLTTVKDRAEVTTSAATEQPK